MPVPFVHHLLGIEALSHGAWGEPAGIDAQAHGAAQVDHILLLGQQVNHGMGRFGIKFSTGGPGETGLVAGPLDHGALHPQAQAQEGHPLLPGPADGRHLAIHAPVAKAAGHHHRIHASEQGFGPLGFDLLGADPVQVEGGIHIQAGMAQGFHHREVGIVELHVFAHQGHLHGRAGVAQLGHQPLPIHHVAGVVGEVEHIQHLVAEAGLLHGQGHRVDAVGIEGFDHRLGGDPAETADLRFEVIADGPIAAAHQDIGLDTDRAQLLDRVLGGLGFQLP